MFRRSIPCLILALTASASLTLAEDNFAFARKHSHAAVRSQPHEAQRSEPREGQQTEEDNSGEMQSPSQEESSADQSSSQDSSPEQTQDSSSQEDQSTHQAGSFGALSHMIDSRFRPPVTPQGISLFNVATNIAEILILAALFGSIPIAGTVMFCAIVWHTGKMMRGGKKPAVG